MARECVCEEFHPPRQKDDRLKKTLNSLELFAVCSSFFFLLEMAVAFAPEVASSPQFAGVLVTCSQESRGTRMWSSLQLCGQSQAGVLRFILLSSMRVYFVLWEEVS